MREKYLALVLGSEEMDLGDPFLLNAHHSLMGSVEKGMEYLDKKGFKRDGKPWDFSGKKNKKKQKEARVLLDKVLPAFATAYAYPGGKQSKNDYYQDEAMLSRVVDTLNYMNEKGWKPGFFIGLDYEELANAGHTGFGGSINNNITGYAKTLAILRDDLEKEGLLERELNMLEYLTEMFASKNKHRFQKIFEVNGFNSDGVKSLALVRLSYLMALPDGDPRFDREMRYFKTFLDNALLPAPGWADTFKEDGTGFHHRAIYGNNYTDKAIERSILALHILHGTTYQADKKGYETLENALNTFAFYHHQYDMPRSICGRFPHNLSTIVKILPAFALMGHPAGIDSQNSRAAFHRLYQKEILYKDEKLREYLSDLSKDKGLGNIGYLEKAIEVGRTKGKAEQNPQGFRFFPQAGLAIYRFDDWMVSIKGASKYIWDWEGGRKQNMYGHYNSAGTVNVYSAPEQTGFVSRRASGYGEKGWDWRTLPNVTAPMIPMDQMGHDHRRFSPETFLGGTHIAGRAGTFAVKYHNMVQDIHVTARKSAFFYNGYIVFLGTDIEHKGDYPVRTTLWQQTVENPHHVKSPYSQKGPSQMIGKNKVVPLSGKLNKGEGNAHVTDAVGNHYIIAEGQTVNFATSNQVAPSERSQELHEGQYHQAWFDHSEVREYQYTLVPRQRDTQKSFKLAHELAGNSKAHFEILSSSKNLHAIRYSNGLQSAVLFESGSTGLREGVLKVNYPAIIMSHQKGDTLFLSATRPDLDRLDADHHIKLSDLKNPDLLYREGKKRNLRVIVSGKWSDPTGTWKTHIMGGKTEITLPTQEGKTVQVELRSSEERK